MFYVSYKFNEFDSYKELEFNSEDEAYAEALELLKDGYCVKISEERF